MAGYQNTEGPEPNPLYISLQNLDRQKSVNLETVIPLRISGRWDIPATPNGRSLL